MTDHRFGLATALAAAFLVPPTSSAQEPVQLRLLVPSDLECPDRADLVEALGRVGVTVDPTDRAAVMLRLEIESAGVRVTLTRDERVSMDRTLPADECAPLADTVALLVDRSVRQLAWGGRLPRERSPTSEVSPAAEPDPAEREPRPELPRSWALAIELGAIAASGLEGLGGPGAWTAVRFLPASIGQVTLSVGWVRHGPFHVEDGSLRVDRLPIALRIGVGHEWSRWTAFGDAGLELELLHASSRDLPVTGRKTRLGLRAGPFASVGYRIVDGLSLALGGGAQLLLHGYRFEVGGVADPVASQADLALEAMLSARYLLAL